MEDKKQKKKPTLRPVRIVKDPNNTEADTLGGGAGTRQGAPAQPADPAGTVAEGAPGVPVELELGAVTQPRPADPAGAATGGASTCQEEDSAWMTSFCGFALALAW